MLLWVVPITSVKDYSEIRGFHLIEVLMTLAIIAVLVALSWPLYSQHFVHERRMEAQGMLAKLALSMEEFHIQHNTYQGATLHALKFPEQIVKNQYLLMIHSATDDDFLLIAKALGNQAKRDKTCKTLTLRANGERGVVGHRKPEDCWR